MPAADVQPDDQPEPGLCDEAQEVLHRRFLEARRAGLSVVAAHVFAASDMDIGDHHGLRALVRDHCPERLLARIVRPL